MQMITLIGFLVMASGTFLNYSDSQGVEAIKKASRKPGSVGCVTGVDSARKHLLEDGTVADENAFLVAATDALVTCTADGKTWKKMPAFISKGKDICDQAADQGMSKLYRGTCYLKLADLVSWIL